MLSCFCCFDCFMTVIFVLVGMRRVDLVIVNFCAGSDAMAMFSCSVTGFADWWQHHISALALTLFC